MKIVRIRISGWAIQRQRGGLWLYNASPTLWTPLKELAHVFKRLSEAEKWLAENSLKG